MLAAAGLLALTVTAGSAAVTLVSAIMSKIRRSAPGDAEWRSMRASILMRLTTAVWTYDLWAKNTAAGPAIGGVRGGVMRQVAQQHDGGQTEDADRAEDEVVVAQRPEELGGALLAELVEALLQRLGLERIAQYRTAEDLRREVGDARHRHVRRRHGLVHGVQHLTEDDTRAVRHRERARNLCIANKRSQRRRLRGAVATGKFL